MKYRTHRARVFATCLAVSVASAGCLQTTVKRYQRQIETTPPGAQIWSTDWRGANKQSEGVTPITVPEEVEFEYYDNSPWGWIALGAGVLFAAGALGGLSQAESGVEIVGPIVGGGIWTAAGLITGGVLLSKDDDVYVNGRYIGERDELSEEDYRRLADKKHYFLTAPGYRDVEIASPPGEDLSIELEER